MSFRDVDTPAAAMAYIDRLNQKWPARLAIMDEITAHLSSHFQKGPTVLELCCGAGVLGHHLLTEQPNITYIGIDQSEPLLGAARELLAPFTHRATLLQADLNQSSWKRQLMGLKKEIDAVVSMQSLHDLGGEDEVSRIYRLAYDQLTPGGLFMNADLIVEAGEVLPNNPGRLTIERHLALLTEAGYQHSACTQKSGGFGVVVGTKM